MINKRYRKIERKKENITETKKKEKNRENPK